MLVRITDRVHTLLVTAGAYEAFYKHQGYQVMGEESETSSPFTKRPGGMPFLLRGMREEAGISPGKKIPTDTGNVEISHRERGEGVRSEEAEEEAEESEYEDDENVELSEIPLEEMTKAQLIAYAEELGVELTGEERKRELRTAIRKAL